MEIKSELSVSIHNPKVYKFDVSSDSMEFYLNLYCTEILHGCTFSNLESVLVDYITSIIDPVGWKAIWRPIEGYSDICSDYDFIVEVVNVSLQKLEADVFVKLVIMPEYNYPALEDLQKKFNVDTTVTVPLIELYTISEDDDEELYIVTASAIDRVRFFMTHIARPWDGEDDDVVYSEEVLRPRLQLYFDMKKKTLPNTMILKIKNILKEGWQIVKELNTLYREMNISDSEAEINEDDLLTSMTLRAKLTELQAKMEMLENPVIRSFMLKKYAPHRSAKSKKSNPVVYIVSKKITFEMITDLNLDAACVLEFEHNAETAFKSSSAGDKILIFPGLYQCDTLGWLDEKVAVEGVGPSNKIILEATGNSEVFLNCHASSINLKNVTLRAKSGLLSSLVVHHGTVYLENCVIDSNQADIGILLLGGAEAFVNKSLVCHSSKDGIQMRALSTLHLISSEIRNSGRHGIQLDAENGNLSENCTELELIKSNIWGNVAYGIFLNNVPLSDIFFNKPEGEFSILKIFPWLKCQIEDSKISDNGEDSIGMSSSTKANKSASDLSPKSFPSCPNQEELNCSVLSDILNEINFTDLELS